MYYGNYNANPYFGKGLTAKIPDALFSKRCGACFKVICSNDTKRCRSGKATVTVRVVGATKTEGKQISLSAVSWAKIVQGSETAPVNITYKRTNCVSTAGSAVRVRSNSTAEHFNIQMVGLAGPGTLTEVELSADGKKWVKLTRDGNKAIWGIKGKEAKAVVGAKKAMSVRLTAGHTREKITLANVIPTAWKPQTLYSSKTNFKKLMAEANSLFVLQRIALKEQPPSDASPLDAPPSDAPPPNAPPSDAPPPNAPPSDAPPPNAPPSNAPPPNAPPSDAPPPGAPPRVLLP
ncbi:unnamed protein product [Closterium sp. NIES-65]|nr:unnamed protein product [Closterium sp. NIES-65]